MKHRVSNNVGAVKRFLSVPVRAHRRVRHFALVDGLRRPNPSPLVIVFQVRNSVRPMHLFGLYRDHDYYFELPVKGSGIPNQLLGVQPHTIAMFGLSRVRTELLHLLVVASPAPFRVAAHRDLGGLHQ